MTSSLLVFLAVLCLVRGFYLPGLAPTNYCREEIKKDDSNVNCKVSRQGSQTSVAAPVDVA